MKKKYYIFFKSILFLILLILPVKADEKFKLGKELFLIKANCASCHTLADADSEGQIGPNLDMLKPNMMRVLNAVTMGIGVMPAYEGQLSYEEIEAVSYYVSKSTKK